MADERFKHTEGEIYMWPTHWAGGSGAFKVNGENAPWLEFRNGGFLALGYGDPYRTNVMANMRHMVKCWNQHAPMKALLKKCLAYIPKDGSEERDTREAIEDILKVT